MTKYFLLQLNTLMETFEMPNKTKNTPHNESHSFRNAKKAIMRKMIKVKPTL